MLELKDLNSTLFSLIIILYLKVWNVITVTPVGFRFLFFGACVWNTQEQSEIHCTHLVSLCVCRPPSGFQLFKFREPALWLERVRRIRTKDRRVSSLCVICQKHSLAKFVPLCRDEYMYAVWYASRIRLNECQTAGSARIEKNGLKGKNVVYAILISLY